MCARGGVVRLVSLTGRARGECARRESWEGARGGGERREKLAADRRRWLLDLAGRLGRCGVRRLLVLPFQRALPVSTCFQLLVLLAASHHWSKPHTLIKIKDLTIPTNMIKLKRARLSWIPLTLFFAVGMHKHVFLPPFPVETTRVLWRVALYAGFSTN